MVQRQLGASLARIMELPPWFISQFVILAEARVKGVFHLFFFMLFLFDALWTCCEQGGFLDLCASSWPCHPQAHHRGRTADLANHSRPQPSALVEEQLQNDLNSVWGIIGIIIFAKTEIKHETYKSHQSSSILLERKLVSVTQCRCFLNLSETHLHNSFWLGIGNWSSSGSILASLTGAVAMVDGENPAPLRMYGNSWLLPSAS